MLSVDSKVTTSFEIEIVERDTSLILVVKGEVDLSTVPVLDTELARAAATDAETILVDLVHVDFMDSSGLHVLTKHACSDGNCNRVHLTRGSPQVQRLFELSGALDHLPFVASRVSAGGPGRSRASLG